MNPKYSIYILGLLFNGFFAYSQVNKQLFSMGLKSGIGNEFKNSNYTFTNNYYKIEVDYQVKKTQKMSYEIVVQPEINFGTHQLLNLYFISPDEANYEAKREEFTKLKDVNQYVLNVGFLARKTLYKHLNIFAQISVGPMLSDTETERLSKGFAFSDTFAFGLSLALDKIRLDISPTLRHVSNAGLQRPNAGFNTKNIEFGVIYKL